MEGIGASIVNGAFGAVGHMLGLVPIMVWIILALAIVSVIFVIRYITNWHVIVPLILGFVIISVVMTYRAHWISMGYEEAQAEVRAAKAEAEGYKRTEGLIEACYTRDGNVWDRTQGKCVRKDGSM